MHEVVVGLGSNLGSKRALLDAAVELLASVPGVQLRTRSQLYRSAPVGPPQPDYLNAALRLSWAGGPHALLDVLLHVEAILGRERRVRWGPRSLDLDILWWNGTDIHTPRLHVPHPELRHRHFALAPLLDVAPELAPTYGPTLRGLGEQTPPRTPWIERDRGIPRDLWAGRQFEDAAEALAEITTSLAPAGCVPAGPLTYLAWNPNPQQGLLRAPLLTVCRTSRWGFWWKRAVVLNTSEGFRGRLIGWYGTPAITPETCIPALRLVQEPRNGGVTVVSSA